MKVKGCVLRSVSPVRPVSGPFSLDLELLRQLEGSPVRVLKPKLIEINLSFLKEDVPKPQDYPSIMPIHPPKRILPKSSPGLTATSAAAASIAGAVTPPSNQLADAVHRMASTDLHVALPAIQQLEEALHHQHQLHDLEDAFMAAVAQQLGLLYALDPRADPLVLKTYRALLTVLATFYDTKVLGKRITTDVLKDTLYQLITLLVDTKLEKCEGSDAYNRVINLQCVRIIEKSDHTNIICALICLLHECVSSNCSARFLDLVMKCLWRVIKIIPSWSDDMDYDTILVSIHLFFRDFPTSSWKQKPSDTPLRTIKTIVHAMAKIKGNGIMAHLSKVHSPNESELQAYLVKLLKTLKLDEVKQIPLKKELRRPLSRAMHTTLSEIFQKIGSKEDTKEGLTLLYDFRQQHPEADIEPYLERSSHFFQEYIERGLKDIETSRKRMVTEPASVPIAPIGPIASAAPGNTVLEPNKESPEYWMDRLRMWNNVATDNKVQDENLNTSTDREYQDALASAEETTRRVDEIRRRIDKMKTPAGSHP